MTSRSSKTRRPPGKKRSGAAAAAPPATPPKELGPTMTAKPRIRVKIKASGAPARTPVLPEIAVPAGLSPVAPDVLGVATVGPVEELAPPPAQAPRNPVPGTIRFGDKPRKPTIDPKHLRNGQISYSEFPEPTAEQRAVAWVVVAVVAATVLAIAFFAARS
jgi:hypothetical protein